MIPLCGWTKVASASVFIFDTVLLYTRIINAGMLYGVAYPSASITACNRAGILLTKLSNLSFAMPCSQTVVNQLLTMEYRHIFL